MGRVKHSLGLFLTSALIVVALCFSFWIGTEPMQKWQSFDWQRLGLVQCDFDKLAVGDNVTENEFQGNHPGNNWARGEERSALAGCITFLSDRALQINAWHMLIYDALHVHCPAWSELQNRGQNCMLEYLTLNFLPVLLLTLIPACLSHHFIEKPCASVFRKLSERCYTPVLYIFLVGYSLLCSTAWFADWFR